MVAVRVRRCAMYKTFRVKNFRCFKDLQINDLGRVNLIAGKNNTGKTALLEAMYLHTKPLSPHVLIDLQMMRGLEVAQDYLPRFWKQYFFQMNSTQPIMLYGTGSLPLQHQELRITEYRNTSANFQTIEQLYGDLMRRGLVGTDAHAVMSSIDRLLHFELVTDEDKSPSVIYFRDPWSYKNSDVEQKSFIMPVQGRPGKQEVASLFSQLEIDGTLNSLIETLQVFEPELSDLRLLSPDGEMIIWALLKGQSLPMRLMGEGMNQICHIALTLFTNPNCVVFIDEIENGIHYTVQKDVWKAIGQVARDLDIQVFATTHSLEMIRAAYEAFTEEDKLDEFRYHRLDRDRDTGDIEAVTYNELDLDAVATFEFDFEVRG